MDLRWMILLFSTSIVTMNAQFGVAYLSNESGNFDLFWISEDGKIKNQITTNPGWDWSPTWHEESKTFIYNSSDTSGNFTKLKVTLDGVIDTLDTKGKEEYILSPDGNQFLYSLQDGSHRYIGLYDLELSTNKLLIADACYNGRMKWSPDGRKFSFISDRVGNNELYVYHLNSNAVKRLTKSDKSEKYTSWMPDSKSLVYTYHYSDERDAEHNDIYLVNLETGEISQITDDEKFYQEIAVSPDGSKIAFHAKREGKDHIYLMDIDGSNEVQLTKADAYHGEPVWSLKN